MKVAGPRFIIVPVLNMGVGRTEEKMVDVSIPVANIVEIKPLPRVTGTGDWDKVRTKVTMKDGGYYYCGNEVETVTGKINA